jgi:hypothetical protein
MTAREFIINSDPIDCGWSVWFRLYVYETIDELNRAAKRYSPAEAEFINCLGIFHPRLTLGVDEKGKYFRTRNTKYIGVMRLTREECDPGIVIHECTHAAINYVSALKGQVGYMVGNSNLKVEEPLCHAVQEFSQAVLKVMGYSNYE